MKTRLYIIAALGMLNFSTSLAQSGQITKAKKTYNDFSYVATSKTLVQLAEKGKLSTNEYQQLANSYYFNGDMESAVKWYGALMTSEDASAIDTESYFRYTQSLKALENYEEADKWMTKFAELKTYDSRAKAFMAQPNYLKHIEKLSNDFELERVRVNSEYSDFGAALHNSQLVFASANGDGNMYNWNSQPFLDLYILAADGTVSALKGDVNTKYHESSAVFTKDGNTMYFTRNNYYNGKFKKGKKGTNHLKIYKATKSGEEWTNIEALPFNSDDYSVGHPALSSDGATLYFSSDMPSGFGASDIYKVAVNSDGTYGNAVNLGKEINTEGRENFPFIDEKGILYFSSEGHIGLGGLDVFKYEKGKPVYNLGRPVNSSKDDFSYIIDDVTLKGYISSNRKGGNGDDDVYTFTKTPCEQVVSGVVVDATTKEVIAKASVEIYNAAKEQVETLVADEKGVFSFKLPCNAETYKIKSSKSGFETYESTFTVEDVYNEDVSLELPLKPIPKAAEVGGDLFKILNLKPILFDYNKSNINASAQVELAKIIAYMKEFPEVKIDVRSHTDARGRDSYNLALSTRRNKSTVNYIITEGAISKDRVSGKGYGESQLLNKCSNGVKCSEEAHQENRRSEFIVTEN